MHTLEYQLPKMLNWKWVMTNHFTIELALCNNVKSKLALCKIKFYEFEMSVS